MIKPLKHSCQTLSLLHRVRLQLCVVFYFAIAVVPLFAQVFPTIRGFTAANAIEQERYEEAFKRLPSPDRCRQALRYLTEEPHLAGSYKIAQYLYQKY